MSGLAGGGITGSFSSGSFSLSFSDTLVLLLADASDARCVSLITDEWTRRMLQVEWKLGQGKNYTATVFIHILLISARWRFEVRFKVRWT